MRKERRPTPTITNNKPRCCRIFSIIAISQSFLKFRGANIVNTNALLLGRQDGRLAESGALKTALTSVINDERTIPMDYYVESGDFLRINNASIGYTLPVKGVFKRARIYVAGNNLLLFTPYLGVDPEISSNGDSNLASGIERNSIPQGRAFTFGINIGL
jgi:iron complex outermembrane receptor protein